MQNERFRVLSHLQTLATERVLTGEHLEGCKIVSLSCETVIEEQRYLGIRVEALKAHRAFQQIV